MDAEDVFDHLAGLAAEYMDDHPDFDVNPETMHESVMNMTEDQLAEYYDYEDWESAQEASAADADHPLKYH